MVFLPRFYFALASAILLALASSWLPGGLTFSVIATLLLTCAVLADIVFIPRDLLRIRRQVSPVLRQAQLFEVELGVLNQGQHAAWCQVIDSPPVEFSGSARLPGLWLPPGEEITRRYTLRSYRRGSFEFGTVFYRITGPLGLIQRQGRIDLPRPCRSCLT